MGSNVQKGFAHYQRGLPAGKNCGKLFNTPVWGVWLFGGKSLRKGGMWRGEGSYVIG